MKKIAFFIFISCNILSSCKSTIINTSTEVSSNLPKLSGTWELNYISKKKIALATLYPDKKPQITFNSTKNEISGNTSCNGFNSKTAISGNKITIFEPLTKTMMFCQGDGENSFLEILTKVTNYSINNDNTLNLNIGNTTVMRFIKK